MKRFLLRPFYQSVLALLVAGLTAQAGVIVPTNIHNHTTVPVDVTTVRIVSSLFPQQRATNLVTVTIQPGKEAPVMLMGGAHGVGSSYTKQVTIAEAATAAQPAINLVAPPLILTNNIDVRWSREGYGVDIDPQTGRFTFLPEPSSPPNPPK